MNEHWEYTIFVGPEEYGTFISLQIAVEVANQLRKTTHWRIDVFGNCGSPDEWLAYTC